jgi:hypothetical protein
VFLYFILEGFILIQQAIMSLTTSVYKPIIDSGIPNEKPIEIIKRQSEKKFSLKKPYFEHTYNRNHPEYNVRCKGQHNH